MMLKFKKNYFNFWLAKKIIEMTKKSPISNQSLQIPKPILFTAKLLEAISPKLVTLFAAKLFTTPIKHKIPKRELHMEQNSQQSKLLVPSLKKEIMVYEYGRGEKKVLLVHGWSGRGTQLVKIADELVKLGYQIVSFDAPAHGKSEGKTTIMTEFITSILEIEKQLGPFEFAIGHSLGAKEALYLAAFDERIKAAAASEGGIGFRSTNWDASWYLGEAIRDPEFPLNHHQLLGLIAPRPFLILGGETGPGAADGDRSWPLINAALPVWNLYGEPTRLGLLNHHEGHSVSEQSFERMTEWLTVYLAH